MSVILDKLRNGVADDPAAYVDREVRYSGVTNGSGIYAVTYPVAYGSIPNVILTAVGGTNKDSSVLTSTTAGFSILMERRSDVLGLLPSYATISGLTVNVSVYS